MVTPRAAHIGLAVTVTRLCGQLLAGALVTHTLVHRAVSLAVTQGADVGVSDLPLRILNDQIKSIFYLISEIRNLIISRDANLTVFPLGVVLTVIAHAPAGLSTCLYSLEFYRKLQGDTKDI